MSGEHRNKLWRAVRKYHRSDKRPTDQQYRDAAGRMYLTDDDIEIELSGTLSVADDGAWVQAWIWVPDSEAAAEEDKTAP
jgi:hypothetical protein